MPKIRSGLIDGLSGRYVILQEDELFWAAEIVDIDAIGTSENFAEVAQNLAAYQQFLCVKSEPGVTRPHVTVPLPTPCRGSHPMAQRTQNLTNIVSDQ